MERLNDWLQGRRTFTAKDKGLRIHVSMPTTWSNTLLLTTTNLLQLRPALPLYLWPDKVSFLLRFFFLVANLFGFISKQLLNYPETHQITRSALLPLSSDSIAPKISSKGHLHSLREVTEKKEQSCPKNHAHSVISDEMRRCHLRDPLNF